MSDTHGNYWDEQEAMIGEELARREKKESNVQIEGPYSFKAVDGLKTPVYIFKRGGEKKIIGEATVKVDGGMTFDVQLEEEYKDIETGSFEVPMRYTYLNLPDKPQINWGFNCLTEGIHHGNPEPIWNIPLMQAISIFRRHVLKSLVVARIYNDALQYVDHSPFVQKGTGATMEIAPEWATRTREIAEERYDRTLQLKVGELSNYYNSPEWEREQQDTARRVIEDKLNPGYKPLHPHDSINLLCRILGTKSAIEASKDIG